MFGGVPPPTYLHSTSKYAKILKHPHHLYYKGLVDNGNDSIENIHTIV